MHCPIQINKEIKKEKKIKPKVKDQVPPTVLFKLLELMSK